jgi:serine/threonine-protein kinase
MACLAAGSVAEGARADEAPAQAADRLFHEARALMTERSFSEACRKLEQSQRLDPGAGTLLNLAGCYEHLGRSASAWATYLEAANLAERSGEAEWEAAARKRAASLEPTLSTLTIHVPKQSHVQDMWIERDGTRVEPAQWGIPIPVDPLRYSVVVSAPGRLSWRTTVLVDGDAGNTSVTVPELAPVVTEPVVASGASPARTHPERQRPAAPDVPHHGSGQTTVALAVGGVGVVGLAVGSVFGLMAKSTYDDSSKHCDERNRCSREGLDLDDRAHQFATISTVSFGVGIVAVATGGTLLLTAPAAPSEDVAIGSSPVPGGAAFSVKGVW